MFVPVNLHYTNNHLWLRDIGRQDAYVGITDYAQKELGRIDFVGIEREGGLKKKGESFGTIYGSNKHADLIMPFDGRILMVNQDIETNPKILNSDPYHYWLVLLTATNSLAENIGQCFTSEHYRRALNSVKLYSK